MTFTTRPKATPLIISTGKYSLINNSLYPFLYSNFNFLKFISNLFFFKTSKLILSAFNNNNFFCSLLRLLLILIILGDGDFDSFIGNNLSFDNDFNIIGFA